MKDKFSAVMRRQEFLESVAYRFLQGFAVFIGICLLIVAGSCGPPAYIIHGFKPYNSYMGTVHIPENMPTREQQARYDRRFNNFELVHKEPMMYSAAMRGIWDEGFVSIQAIVGNDGRVISAKVTRGLHPVVDRAALESAYGCTFRRRFPTVGTSVYEVRISYWFR